MLYIEFLYFLRYTKYVFPMGCCMSLVFFCFLACDGEPKHTGFLLDPTWEQSALQEALDDTLSYGLPSSNDFWLLYQELYDEGGTPSCPGTDYNFDGNELTAYDCYTPEGFQFEGLSEFMYELGGWRLHLEGRILAPDGRLVHGAGSVSIEEMDGIVRQAFEGTLYTNFGADWLQQRPSLVLFLEKSDDFYLLDGGYSIGGKSVFFKNFIVGTCPLGEGELLFRDPSGGWWQYNVHPECSGTGRLSFNGDYIGELALDISSLEQELARVFL